VRAVIVRDGLVAMVHSLKYDYYKFPGGGIEPDESPLEALAREVSEEAGLRIRPETVRPFGSALRVERVGPGCDEIFEQENAYYLCETEEGTVERRLDDYEADERFTLEFVAAEDAIRVNRASSHGSKSPLMVERESLVLERLLAEGVCRAAATAP
jgi:8-oxo-dGTP pyrophosphatase MutT (NUDIX family)